MLKALIRQHVDNATAVTALSSCTFNLEMTVTVHIASPVAQ